MGLLSPASASRSSAYWRMVSRSRYEVGPSRPGCGDDHRLVDEAAERGERVVAGRRVAPHGERRREVQAAPEHRQPAEHPTLVRGEEVVAPVDRRAHRPVALEGRLTGSGGQVHAALQPLDDVRQRQAPEAGRRQFDGERQAVEPAAQRHCAGEGGPDSSKPGRAASARSASSCIESAARISATVAVGDGRSRPETAQVTSPGAPSGSRLVARIRSPGAPARSSAQRPATIGSTCSQLSSSSRLRWFRRRDRMPATSGSPRRSRTSMPSAMRRVTEPPGGSVARETRCTSARRPAATARASSSARRLLPHPPGPTSVSSRDVTSRSRASRRSRSRPTKRVVGTGSPAVGPARVGSCRSIARRSSSRAVSGVAASSRSMAARTRSNVASASLDPLLRYWASMSRPASRSSVGSPATSPASSATTVSFSPRARHASARSTWAARRRASRRVASAPAIRPVASPSRAGPRHASSALASCAAAIAGCRSSSPCASPTAISNRRASISSGRAASR